MDAKTISNNILKALTGGMHSAIVDGVIVHDIRTEIVFVTQESELDNFDDMPAGTFAATYGLGAWWQKDASGEWVDVEV